MNAWIKTRNSRHLLVLCVKNVCCLCSCTAMWSQRLPVSTSLNADKWLIPTRIWTLQWNPGCSSVFGVDLCPFEALLRLHEPCIEMQRWEAAGEAGSTRLRSQFQGQAWLRATTWTPSSRTEE